MIGRSDKEDPPQESKQPGTDFDRARRWVKEREKQRQPLSDEEINKRFNHESNLLNERFGGVTNASHQR